MAGAWIGVALPSHQGTKAYVAKIYHRQYVVLVEYDEGVMIVKNEEGRIKRMKIYQ